MVIEKFIFTDLSAMIADYGYYTVNELAIDKWLEEHNSYRKGMVVRFDSEQTKMMFMLRWS